MAGILKITSEPTGLRVSKGAGYIGTTPYVIITPYPTQYIIVEGWTLANFPGYTSPYVPTPLDRITHLHVVFSPTGYPTSATITDEGPVVLSLSANKTSAKTGESITFSGKWIPNGDINIYYDSTTIFGTPWKEHVITIKSDFNGDYKAIAIIPSDAVTTATTLNFKACTPGSLGFECETGTDSNVVSITISPGILLPASPDTYTKSYPANNTYSGSAVKEKIHAETFKYFSVTDTRAISLEEAMDNILMGIETTALQQGVTPLSIKIDYNETLLNYIFDIEYTYINPMGSAGLYMTGSGIQSLILPAVPLTTLIYAVLIVIALALAVWVLVEISEIITSPAGALLAGGIGLILIAGAAIYILPKILPKILPAAKSVTSKTKEELTKLTKGG